MDDQIDRDAGIKIAKICLCFGKMANGVYKRARAVDDGETDLCLM